MADQPSHERSEPTPEKSTFPSPYAALVTNVIALVQQARVGAIRSVNVFLTSTYWLIGQRIIEHEQSGAARAGYGQELLKRLSRDLKSQLGRGFSERNLEQMRLFYLNWPQPPRGSPDSNSQTVSAKLDIGPQFPLPWSHYLRLLSVSDPEARRFYEREALQGGWSVRQLTGKLLLSPTNGHKEREP